MKIILFCVASIILACVLLWTIVGEQSKITPSFILTKGVLTGETRIGENKRGVDVRFDGCVYVFLLVGYGLHPPDLDSSPIHGTAYLSAAC